MGNRILKETIRTSNEIDALGWFEEVVFYRLIVTVDDYGIYPADPVLLSHILFPRKENISRRMLESALERLEQGGLIRRYRVEGKGVFLCLPTWNRHQRLRKTLRKYPGPDEAAAEEPETAPAKETVKESEELPGKEADQETAAKTAAKTTENPGESPVITIPLIDGSEFGVLQQDADEYASLYPAVDVLQEFRSMRGWCLSNAARRKTRAGVRRFINSWMARAQDRGGTLPAPPGIPARPGNPYQAMVCEGDVL